jgi:hypothetical protein
MKGFDDGCSVEQRVPLRKIDPGRIVDHVDDGMCSAL